MSTTVTKTFKMAIRIDGCPIVFIEGEEPGVIATQQIKLTGRPHNALMLAALRDHEMAFLQDCVKVDTEIIE